MLDKHQIAAALREIALLLPLKGESPFKSRAYERGADAVEALEADLGELVDAHRLTEVEGIGEALAAKIAELFLTGRCAYLEGLVAELPPGVIELSRVPGLGSKKLLALRDALGVSSVAELKAACEAHRVRGVKGFGEKSEQKILDGIRRFEERGERVLLCDALPPGERLLALLAGVPSVRAVELAGSARRRAETVGDLDFVVDSEEAAAVAAAMADFPSVHGVEQREAEGGLQIRARLSSGLGLDVRVVPPARWGTALLRATGSKAHRARLDAIASARGLPVDEDAKSESEAYARLGLPLIPPELREDEGEIDEALARGGEAFTDLVELADVRGLVHCHTVYSDGINTIEEMARAADALGMDYLTITDHSPAAHYANGVTVDRLERQWDELARVQERVKVRLLRGTESDILEDGGLDYPDAVLERLDVIIASVHSRFKLDEEQMTRRLVRAMRHPLRKVWGHALGRLVLRRDPIACRVEEVLDAVAESRAAIEVNGDPHRLDLAPQWIRAARRRRIPFVISTDAHSVDNLGYLKYGVWTARRGGLRRSEVLNTLSTDEFLAAVRPV